MGPVIHDAVTLRHFAAVGRMDVLEACHGHRPEPRWTEGIEDAGRSLRPIHRGARDPAYFDH